MHIRLKSPRPLSTANFPIMIPRYKKRKETEQTASTVSEDRSFPFPNSYERMAQPLHAPGLKTAVRTGLCAREEKWFSSSWTHSRCWD